MRPSLAGRFTPRSMQTSAVIFVLVFVGLNVAGLRPYVSFFTATWQDTGALQYRDAFFAIAYAIAYLLAVLAAPILLITSGLHALWNRISPNDDSS